MAVKGRTGMTALVTSHGDDENVLMTGLSFPFPYYGANYTNTNSYVVSNSFVSFGQNTTEYDPLNTNIRGLSVMGNDRSYQWVGYESNADWYRIRWEGNGNYAGSDTNYIWEVTLFRDGVIQLDLANLPANTLGRSFITNMSSATASNFTPVVNQTIRFTPKATPSQGYDILTNAPEYSMGGGDTGTDGSTAFDTRVMQYQDTSTYFDTKQTVYQDSQDTFDSKIIQYQDGLTSFDTLVSYTDDGIVGSLSFDTKIIQYQDSSLSFDTIQDLYEAGEIGSSAHDIRLVLYDDSSQSHDIKVAQYEDSSRSFDTSVVFTDNRFRKTVLFSMDITTSLSLDFDLPTDLKESFTISQDLGLQFDL